MTKIEVRKIDGSTFEVAIEGKTRTVHTVVVTPEYVERLTAGALTAEALIEQSFVFLLEREPNTSILRRFDLEAIGHYFPEYEATIRKRIGR
ncbi:MAG TPA: hypothetical protein VNL74_09945 [Methylococcus sp.]|nr:hypothetical protein [Methylococcus sp.]